MLSVYRSKNHGVSPLIYNKKVCSSQTFLRYCSQYGNFILTLPYGLARFLDASQNSRLFAFEKTFFSYNDFTYALVARNLEHNIENRVLNDRFETSRARIESYRSVGYRIERFLVYLKLRTSSCTV